MPYGLAPTPTPTASPTSTPTLTPSNGWPVSVPWSHLILNGIYKGSIRAACGGGVGSADSFLQPAVLMAVGGWTPSPKGLVKEALPDLSDTAPGRPVPKTLTASVTPTGTASPTATPELTLTAEEGGGGVVLDPVPSRSLGCPVVAEVSSKIKTTQFPRVFSATAYLQAYAPKHWLRSIRQSMLPLVFITPVRGVTYSLRTQVLNTVIFF